MALELRDCTFYGPALPEPFVKFPLEEKLKKLNLLPKTTGPEGRTLEERWEVFRRKLRQLGEQGGDRRVANHVLEPLIERLGYASLEQQAAVITREGAEDGGWLFSTPDGKRLRGWAVSLGTDLDAPNRRGRAYRFSPSRVAQRVLLASGERMGLLTDGEELRILICDPARPDSHIGIRLDRAGGWRAVRALPDSYRLLLALASPAGVAALPDLTDAARLAQSSVTKKLRLQARRAIEGFLQELLDHPTNQSLLAEQGDRQQLAWRLWSEGLITVYRLLFVFKLEASADPARAFSFAATSLWRNTYSPNTALADLVRRVLDEGKESGGFLEAGLRTLWRLFAEGMSSSELEIKPLGGMLFGRGATPVLDQLQWGEQAVARLLDALLWTPGEGGAARERVHYGALDVEDLGRVYESLLELEPGISGEAMCRLRRAKLEVVVPVAQGEPYRANQGASEMPDATDDDEAEGSDEAAENTGHGGRAAAGSKTKVEFIEEIPADRFFLRVGLGRKASGSYYTPHPFVRFLVQETLGVLLAECSPRENPQPALILRLKVLDPAMGSGHFLVEACRFLGEGLYEACRLCDELAVQAEEQAEKLEGAERESLLARAADLRRRVEDLPDPNNELLAYLPSRAAEGEESGLSQKKAEAMCRRLVAVHCLYGVDKNPLAVELAKLSLWLESYAEGLPLTFLDHRLICGDSLTGPFFEHLLTFPKSGGRLDDLFAQGLTQRLQDTLEAALVHVRDLEASVGKDLADLHLKESAKAKLDAALAPLKTLAAAWSGGVMLGDKCNDTCYLALAQAISKNESLEQSIRSDSALEEMIELGGHAVSFQLAFPEVFFAEHKAGGGYDAVIGNPPWEGVDTSNKEFFAGFEIAILDARTLEEEGEIMNRLYADSSIRELRSNYERAIAGLKNTARLQYKNANQGASQASGATPDLYQLFTERTHQLLRDYGHLGLVLPYSFHANEGAAGLRRLVLHKMALKTCFSFENQRKIFEIDQRYKFACVVAAKDSQGTSQFDCAFYLRDPSWLFANKGSERLLRYTLGFVNKTTPVNQNFLELRLGDSVDIVESMYSARREWFGEYRRRLGVTPTEELHKTKNKWRLELTSATSLKTQEDPRHPDVLKRLIREGYMPFCEGKTFHQFQDAWGERPEFCVAINRMNGKESRMRASCYYRTAFRTIARSGDERSGIFSLMPPGMLFSNSALPESAPERRSNASALELIAVCNSLSFDWLLRQQVAANITYNFLDAVPVPDLSLLRRFLGHGCLRLVCNHSGYESLWQEQLGMEWHEKRSAYEWPAVGNPSDRTILIAAIDAAVAHAYSLEFGQYKRLLHGFTHRSNPAFPSVCLEAYEELGRIGLNAFVREHDPYWDIPLNENLPQPVLDLEIPGQAETFPASLGPLFDSSATAANAAEIGMSTTRTDTAKPATRAPAPPVRPSGNGAFTTILELLRSRDVITSSDAQQATGLDASGVRPHLQRLVSEGLAVTEGQRRGMKYRRVDD